MNGLSYWRINASLSVMHLGANKVSHYWSISYSTPGHRFNIKMLSYQYRKSHCGDKTILRPSHLHNGISYTGKTSLYWIGAQVVIGTIPQNYQLGQLGINFNEILTKIHNFFIQENQFKNICQKHGVHFVPLSLCEPISPSDVYMNKSCGIPFLDCYTVPAWWL